jgi:hypothetical protein
MLFITTTIMTEQRINARYLPKTLSKKDKLKQLKMLQKSRTLYKKQSYFTRSKLASFKNKPSKHILKARKIYGITSIVPSKELSLKTGCSMDALKQIVKRGEGAYYSSGSRPNQTAKSWGYGRLASALTSGKSAAVDYSILQKGCNPHKTAMILANKSRKKYGVGLGHAKTVKLPV